MRVVNCAGLAVAALLLASVASAQGLGDAAAREKEKRKAAPAAKPAKVFTESDLGSASSTAPAPAAEAAPAGGEKSAADAAAGGAKPGEQDPEKAAAEAAAKAKQEWQNRLDQARTEQTNIQANIDRLQSVLAGGSGMYSSGWSAAMANLEDAKKKLVDVQAKIESLEAEGRSAGYR
jgi:hypothetical protein